MLFFHFTTSILRLEPRMSEPRCKMSVTLIEFHCIAFQIRQYNFTSELIFRHILKNVIHILQQNWQFFYKNNKLESILLPQKYMVKILTYHLFCHHCLSIGFLKLGCGLYCFWKKCCLLINCWKLTLLWQSHCKSLLGVRSEESTI